MGQQLSLFQSITTQDRLPSNYVFDISEDEHGFFWAGTDKGLAKYDGFKWEVLDMDNRMPGNYIKRVLCNGKGGIWLGVATKGLYHYQISTGKMTFVCNGSLDYQCLLNQAGDLFFYDMSNAGSKTGKLVKAGDPAKAQTIFSYNDTMADYALSVDFDKQHIELINKSGAAKNKRPFLHNYLGWKIDTLSFSISYADILRKETDALYSSTNSLYFVQSAHTLKQVPVFGVHNAYLSVLKTEWGYWLWDGKSGLYAADKAGTVTKHYAEKEGLTSLMVTDMMQAKNGTYLIGTLGGGLLCKLPEGNAVINTKDKLVKGLSQFGNTVYATMGNELLQFDIAKPNALVDFTLADKNIQGVDVWGDDVFISSLYGFSVYSVKGNRLLKKDVQSIGAGISSVVQVKNQFYAGSFGTGVWLYDNRQQQVTERPQTFRVSEKVQALSNGYAAYNYEDGLELVYDNATVQLSTKQGLPSNAIYHVHEYKDTIWISTAMGLAAYTHGSVVKTYSGEDGIKGSRCMYAFHDNNGKLWVLTDKHLNEWVGNRFNALTSVTVAGGYDDAPYCCLYNLPNNTLIIGTLRKIISISLNNIKRTAPVAQPVVAAVYADGKPVANPFSFTLPDDHQSISFCFKPVDANPFVRSFIYYKLEGWDGRYIELKDSLTHSFAKLRHGRYQLFAKTINADGVESREELLATFWVEAPFWQKGWFIGLGILAAALGLFGLYYFVRKNKERKIMAARLLEDTLGKERERISKDLHDHLGTSLVTMIAQADNIENQLLNKQMGLALEKVQQLSDQSREMVNVLRETIWAVQENSHGLDEFILRTRSFLQRVLPQKNIDWEVKVQGDAQLILTPNQSLQLFRAIQEATQNIVKHAGASSVCYIFAAAEKELQVSISDNGKGFDPSANQAGNGLKNMEARMYALQGRFAITYHAGTTIHLYIPITPKS